MEQAEIEALVGELESRIDRLRSLYDMYFMGIERLEPLVPRKDVERRMAALRKEQIRNTGLRFKFNVIIQRFNTYQTYWLRIARQIEQGTYRRDVMRATARFGVDPTKEQRTATAAEPEPAAAVHAKPEAPALELSMDELEDGSAFLLPLDTEDDPFADISVRAPPARARAEGGRSLPEKFGSTVRLDLDDLGDPFEEQDPFPKPAAAPSSPSLGPKMRIAPRPGSSGSPGPAPDAADPRIPAAPAPRIALRVAGAPGTVGSAAPPPTARGNEPRVIIAKRASIPDEAERAVSARPGPPAASAAAPTTSPLIPALQRPATAPTITRMATATAAASATPGASRSQAPGPAMAPPSAIAAPRPPGPPPGIPSRAPPPVPPARPPAPAAPASTPGVPAAPRVALAAPSPPRAPFPSAPGPSAPGPSAPARSSAAPAATAPQPRPLPRPAPAVAVAVAVPTRPVGDLSGDRFGEIYSKYVETRRERNEPTHAITREALAKQLNESTERLKQKHGGKPIDFEVVVKDGKTILRPIVK